MTPEQSTAAALRQVIDAKSADVQRPTLFPALTGGPLEAYGRVEDVLETVIRVANPAITLREFKSNLDHRPRLDVTNQGSAYDWLRENAGEVTLPGIYRRSGYLVRCPRIGEKGYIPIPDGQGDDGPAQVRTLSAEDLASIIQSRFWCYTEKSKDEKDPATGRVVDTSINRTHAMIATSVCVRLTQGVNEWDGLPQVSSVTHTPILRKTGSLLGAPGYDERSSILYLPDPGFSPLEMPEVITREWLDWARDTVTYLLMDFPFEQPGHRANMIALLLTPLLRAVLPPPYPLFLINAHQRGTGKSLLAKVASVLHGGVHRPDLPADDDEIRKQITTVLVTTTAPIVNWDNVTTRISSGNLANLFTSDVWEDRILGRNDRNIKVSNDRVWVATGNNLRLGGDMARRVLWVSIDAKTPKPEYRTGFHEPDLLGYVKSNRGALITALVVLARWWVQRGMPMAELRADDYRRWSGAMYEILTAAGLGEGFGQLETVDTGLSEDEAELQVLVESIWMIYQGQAWTVADLKRLQLDGTWHAIIDAALPAAVKERKDPWKALGWYLKKHEKEYADDKRVVQEGSSRLGIQWRIEQMS